MSEIAVDTSLAAPEPTPITVDTGERPTYALPDDVVSTRVAKAAYGLINLNRTTEDLQRQLAGGQEDQLRAQVAAELDMVQKKQTLDTIQEITRRKGGPLSLEETAQITDLVKKTNEVTDPKNVLEKEYSKRYLDYLGNQISDTYLWDKPPEAEDMISVGKTFLTKNQILQTQIENLRAAVKNQSTFSYGVDVAKDVFSMGLYGEAKQRSQVEGTSFFSGLLGTNKEEQRIALWRNDIPTFTKVVAHIAEVFGQDNPHLALEFLEAMQGNFDKGVDNIWSGLNLATAPGVGTAAKLAFRGIKQTGTAIEDVIKSTKSTLPIKVAAAQGAGDLGEAAVQQSTANIVNNFQGTGNPLKQAVEGLNKVLTEQSIAMAKNPGRGPGSQEISNRIIKQNEELGGSTLNLIASFQRGSRIPAALASEDAVRLMKDAAKENYFGNESRVLDIDGKPGIIGPTREPFTNTWHWEYQIGHHDGTMFGSEDVARATARIEGIVLKGESDSARQIQLQKLIRQTEYELSYSRMARNPSEETRSVLGLTSENKTPKFEENIKSLETNLTKYQEELADLQTRPGATIEQQGAKFYISMMAPLNETDKVTRALLHSTPESQPASGFINSFTGWLRTGEETASKDAMDMAKIAIYGQNNLLALAKKELKDVYKLARFTIPGTARKQQYLDLMDTLKAGRTEGLYDTVAELEEHYLQHYNRFPHPRETAAYFAAKRYGTLQNVLEDMRVFSQESRQGAMNYQLRAMNAAGESVSSVPFKAIERHELPKDAEGVVVMSDKLGNETIGKLTGKKNLDNFIKEGRMRVLEVLYPNEKPLKGFSNIIADNHVQFVITDKAETSPLSFSKSTREGQGLWDLDYPYYLKQAIMEYDAASKTWRYKGDKTIMPISNGGLGHDLLQHFEAVRTAIAKGDYGAAKLAAKQLPIEWKDHASWYNQTLGADSKIVPPKLSINEPIKLVPGNKLIGSMDNELENRFTKAAFRDDTKGNIIYKNLIKGEQDTFDLYTIRAEGTRYNPMYKYEKANYIDPVPSMNRAMKGIVKSVFMDDYKTFTVEHWIQQAAGHLDATPEQLAHSPFYYFYHGEFKPGTPSDVVSRLRDAQFKAQAIWGTPSSLDVNLHAISQHMSDSIYSKGTFGLDSLSGNRGLTIDPSWLLAKTTNAAQAVKSAATHAFIGIFSIPQFVVQSMGYATIYGLEGAGTAGVGSFAALLHQYSRMMPQHIDFLDKLASKFALPSKVGPLSLLTEFNPSIARFKPGQFKEANQGLINSGFHLVGSDHSFIDSMLTPKVIGSGKDMILDWGMVPFKEGEKNLRYGAWYTSYLKYRAENPFEAIDQQGWREIFSRADLLAGNMSAASKSALQRGPGAFTTQFLGYSLRVAELMTGKRITWTERARMITTYASLFGVSALGLTGLPAGDLIRKAAIDNGYTEQSEEYKKWAMEGLPSQLLYMATGKRYNVGGRYGDTGFGPIRDIMAGDKPTWQLIGGASTSMLTNALTAGDGFKRAVQSMFARSNEFFPLMAEDFTQPFKSTITSVGSTTRFMEALHSGDWLSRKGDIIDKGVTPGSALFMTLTGLQSQDSANLQNIFGIDKDRKTYLQNVEKEWLHNGERWIRAMANKDEGQAKDYGRRMNFLLEVSGYPVELQGQLGARLEKTNQSLIERGNYNLYLNPRTIPMPEREDRQKSYRRTKGFP